MKYLASAIILTAIIMVSFSMESCNKNTNLTDAGGTSAKDTWTIIQDKILTPSCATSGCHAATTDANYVQHNLLLTSATAYDNLINITSKNAAAKAAGLVRVKPGDYMNSFLFQKIDCQTTTQYGALMPLGGPNLTLGQIEFIKQWIIKGAPKKGSVVDETILANNTVCTKVFVPMQAPAASEGFQLSINTFTVSPNTEREVFVSRNTPNTSTVYVNKLIMQGRPNSHHFVLYGFQSTTLLPPVNTLRDLYNANGSINTTTFVQMQNHIFLGGGTDVNTTYTFPAGVALKVPPVTALDLNAHYFNKQATNLTGENYINMYTVPQANVVNEAQSINFANYNFSILANSRKTISTDYTFAKAVTVITLTSHFHKLGEKFQIKILGGPRNGEIVYENTDWEHPLVINLTTPIQLKAGEGLTSVVTYNNTTNKTVNFGLTSEDEMNIIFGYYY
jgi:Copper type II ascorbate-dependent monooxygenase, C-terminal domain